MFGFTIEEIQGKSRRRPLVTARQIGMYVFRELTDLSYPAIAREFGGRDHTTVIHAVEKISALMKERRQIYDQVTELTQTIRSGQLSVTRPRVGTGWTSLWIDAVDGARAAGGQPRRLSAGRSPATVPTCGRVGIDRRTTTRPPDLRRTPCSPQSTALITVTTPIDHPSPDDERKRAPP